MPGSGAVSDLSKVPAPGMWNDQSIGRYVPPALTGKARRCNSYSSPGCAIPQQLSPGCHGGRFETSNAFRSRSADRVSGNVIVNISVHCFSSTSPRETS